MAEKQSPEELAKRAFDEALQRVIKPDDQKAAVLTNETLKDGAIERLIAAFEEAAQIDDAGNEFWDARDLQKLLEYSDYRNFLNTVEKAKEACKTTGIPVGDHFVDATEMVDIGSGASRAVETLRLSRYACYLTAQNGDARKKPIAFAQTYFAIQTRRQEVQDDDLAGYTPLPEDEKRLLLRDEIKVHNKKLASAAKNAGVVLPLDFAIFQNAGYQGLYGGLDRAGIQRRKGIKAKQNILDYMGSTELAANLFRATQTEEKLRRDNVKGKGAANETHYAVGRKVREAIADIGGTMPENLPKAEDIVKVGRRLKKAISNTGGQDT
jgi:DNA-damage-inducible protein D